MNRRQTVLTTRERVLPIHRGCADNKVVGRNEIETSDECNNAVVRVAPKTRAHSASSPSLLLIAIMGANRFPLDGSIGKSQH
jgi:hypothetical protein